MLKDRKVELYDFAVILALQISDDELFDVLLVADAPVDVLVSDHR